MGTLDTGVGSGLIANGKLVTGLNYAAGEMGHTVIVYGGLRCNCGRRGCWEKYCSATALIAQTRDAMRENPDSVMWDLVDDDVLKVNGRTAFDAARQGDEAAKKVVDTYVAYLACGISNVVNIFQPEILSIGGGICHEGEWLMAPLRKHIEKATYGGEGSTIKACKVVIAELGNDAGIIGGAVLGI